MEFNTIHQIFRTATGFLASGKIKNAFEQSEILVAGLQAGQFKEEIADLQQNYNYMLQYYISGVNDPDRKRVYNKLVARLYELLWEIREELMLKNSPNYEYSQKRYFNNRYTQNLPAQLLSAFDNYYTQTAEIIDSEIVDAARIKALRIEFENNLPNLFSSLWLITHYSDNEKNLIQTIIADEYSGRLEKTLLVSAITLNLWRMFDEEKLLLLLSLCKHPNIEIQVRAMIGLCFVMARYNRFIPFFPQLRNKLILLADDEQIVSQFKNILIQIISTLETAKITQTMQNEILPELLKLAPQLKDSMESENFLISEEWDEEKPEWQEVIENSSISDKLQEMSDLQIEGADVYMGTFAQMKSFSFFDNVCNWFLPFDTGFTHIAELFEGDAGGLIKAFAGHTAMCDSDKYSFCLAVMQMPKNQRKKLKSTFKLEAEQMEEINNDEKILSPDFAQKNFSKQYVWDIFRFFKLFPQRGDFSDMFQLAAVMHRSYLFDILAADNDEIKITIANYYFNKKHYVQALELFEEIKDTEPTATFFQKLGYAYQKTSKIQNALDAYLKADIINPDDLWNVKKIALCYKLSGNFEKALDYYNHAEFLNPDDLNIKLQKGKCLESMGKLKQAANYYVKLDTENSGSVKVWRALTCCAFISGNLAQAEFYVQRLLDENPDKLDYLYAGHIYWCKNHLQQAADFYIKYYELQQKNWTVLHEAIMRDKQYLQANGVDKDDFRLMLDTVQYGIKS
ncbi:MAG: hypothetical protein LBV75_09415 [Paludibacter sp.]|jgi:tetratricopeptide (TPR) repeat protein|nr:hypothetical protein [Paludibacter sp.]